VCDVSNFLSPKGDGDSKPFFPLSVCYNIAQMGKEPLNNQPNPSLQEQYGSAQKVTRI
jgi:hypothetical protein